MESAGLLEKDISGIAWSPRRGFGIRPDAATSRACSSSIPGPGSATPKINEMGKYFLGNKVYTMFGTHSPVNAGANYNTTWDLFSPGRSIKIKSISWDLKLFNANTFQRISIRDSNSYVFHRLNIGTNATAPLGDVFQNFLPVGFMNYTGQGLTFFDPGQRSFDCFYARNTIGFNFYIENHEAVINVAFEISVIAETEEYSN